MNGICREYFIRAVLDALTDMINETTEPIGQRQSGLLVFQSILKPVKVDAPYANLEPGAHSFQHTR